MYWDIIKATYLKEYKIKICFEDGHNGILDLKQLIEDSPGIFAELKDTYEFAKFKIDQDFKSLKWENGADLAPESAYKRVSK